MAIKQEKWKDVLGYEGYYQVSDHGRVKSIDRVVDSRPGLTQRKRGRVLATCTMRGYQYVGLSINGKSGLKLVHRLALIAFCGDSSKQCNHIDGVKTNNNLSNLEWCTASENQIHKCRVLLSGIGETNGRAKIKEKDVIDIRKRYASGGVSQQKIADEYGLSQCVVGRIISRKLWRHVA